MAGLDAALLNLIPRITDSLPVGIWVGAVPGGERVYANATFSELMRMPTLEEQRSGNYLEDYGLYDSNGDLYHESNLPFAVVLRTGEPITRDDIVVRHGNGQRTHIRAWAKPLRDDQGRMTHVMVAFADTTEQHQTTGQLAAAHSVIQQEREELRQAQLVVDQIHDSVIAVDLDGQIISWNKGSEVMFGSSRVQMIGRHISVIYPPEDHNALQSEIISPLLVKGEHHAEVRLLHSSGRVFHGHLSLSVLAQDGKPYGMIGYTMDVTARVHAAQRQQRLVQELDHRVKNALTVVRSLAAETARKAGSVAAFSEPFLGRLDALVFAHEALAGNRWKGVALAIAVEEVLRGHSVVVLSGPPVMLPPGMTTPLCLALHELATNATKHGALHRGSGQVRISWWCRNGFVKIVWQEVGGETPATPIEPGFGLTLVRGLIEHEVGGKLRLHFSQEGLTAEIRLPVPVQADLSEADD